MADDDLDATVPGRERRALRIVAWMATVCSVLLGMAMLAVVLAVSDCSFAGGRCPDPDPSFESDAFRFGAVAGVLIVAPPLLLARRRLLAVVGWTAATALLSGLLAAT